jgi:hypothetical protein
MESDYHVNVPGKIEMPEESLSDFLPWRVAVMTAKQKEKVVGRYESLFAQIVEDVLEKPASVHPTFAQKLRGVSKKLEVWAGQVEEAKGTKALTAREERVSKRRRSEVEGTPGAEASVSATDGVVAEGSAVGEEPPMTEPVVTAPEAGEEKTEPMEN